MLISSGPARARGHIIIASPASGKVGEYAATYATCPCDSHKKRARPAENNQSGPFAVKRWPTPTFGLIIFAIHGRNAPKIHGASMFEKLTYLLVLMFDERIKEKGPQGCGKP